MAEIKTWTEMLPVRLPETMIDCAMMQITCMAQEIDELRAALVERVPLTLEQKFALVEKHLNLKRYRSTGQALLVIDRSTGRFTDATRYFDLIDEAAHGITVATGEKTCLANQN